MTIDQVPKSDVLFSEAPASWNTRYITPAGFACQITLRGENGRDLLEKAGIALSYLLENGYVPCQNNHRGSNGNAAHWCTVHQCELYRREKDGMVWYSHRLDEGGWCRGKQQKKGEHNE